MTSKRLHYLLLAIIALLCIGLVAMAYGINKLLAAESKDLVELKAKSLALDQEQISLDNAKRDIKKYAELETIAKAVVPKDKSQAEAVREIVKIADLNGVSLGAITFPASNLGGTTTNTAPGAAKPVIDPKAASRSQLIAVPSIPGVYSLQITVNGDSKRPVPYNRFLDFLTDLEHNRRTAQVSAITLQPNTDNPNLLTFTLTVNGYIKP